MITEKELNKAKKNYYKCLTIFTLINVSILLISILFFYFIPDYNVHEILHFHIAITFIIINSFSPPYYFIYLRYSYINYKDKKIDYWNNMSIKELRKLKIQKLNSCK